MHDSKTGLLASAAVADLTPSKSAFLYGYPHVARWSTGVHDPLLASALYLSDGKTHTIFVANDLVFVGTESARRIRPRIEKLTGVPAANVLVSGTHTHSGPITTPALCAEDDPVVPEVDQEYVRFMEDRIVEAAVKAHAAAQPARIGLCLADGSAVGTNRRDPKGASDPQVPVLVVRHRQSGAPIALMMTVNMHPTVLHEDSKLISGDFPGLCRQYLQKHAVGENCPVLYHTGTAGNQSPRHVVNAQSFAEAERLGESLAKSVINAMSSVKFVDDAKIECRQAFVRIPVRSFPPVKQAEQKLAKAVERLERLRRENAPRAEVRTAECDWFGAQETVTLARAAEQGRVQAIADSVMPAEVQLIRVGPWSFVGWSGEMFVEFGLAVKNRSPDTYVIAYANGELQGYLVTQEAVDEGGYEASNAMFKSPDSGNALVSAALKLLGKGG